MARLPTGTVTFLFTDLETSTRLWEEQPEPVMRDALEQHDAIMRDSIARHRGVLISMMGDGVAAAFESAPDAVAAAIDAQRSLVSVEGAAAGLLRARMGLHTDEGRLRAPGEYVNRPLNRCARLMAAAHGGQVLLSDVTAAVTRSSPPPDVELLDLGEHQLRDLADSMRVFQVVHPSLPTEFPPPRSLTTVPGNLPRQVTSFVGREGELARVSALVRERPIVTLTGVGGVGKTRLAVQVAAEVVPDFPAGAWLCELAPVTDRRAVWEAVATSLGIHRNPTRAVEDTVIEFLASQRLLLVVDNCEHLLVEVARVVDAICQRCPHVAVLATSREGLALAGELLVAVPALALPSDEEAVEHAERADAVHLFCDRARDAKPEFVLSETNAGAVTQLCRRLDGIPLAIELAAARVRSLPPDELITRLDQRFRLLTRGSRAALERHQTLRNTIDWSYNLLNRAEQTALTRLSVFAGGCDLLAAETIVGADAEFDALEVLGQLVDKSLVLADDSGRRVRYRMLETIRQYAQERLEEGGETAAIRRRHAEYFVDVAETAGPHLRGREQIEWAALLVEEVENFRAALDWTVESGDAHAGLRLVAPLMVSGIGVGWTAMSWAELAQAIPNAESHHLYPFVAAFAGLGAVLRGDLVRAEVLVERARASQAALGTEHMWVWAAAGVLALFQGNSSDAKRFAAKWEHEARVAADPYEIAQALILLASAYTADEPARAAGLADEAIEISRDAGVASALVYAITLRTNFPFEDEAVMLGLVEEGIEAATMLGDASAVGGFVSFRGWFAGTRGDWATTLRTALDGLDAQLQTNLRVYPGIFGGAAVALAHLGDHEAAAVLWGFAEPWFSMLGTPDFSGQLATLSGLLAEQLGAERAAELFERGAALTDASAVDVLRIAATRAIDAEVVEGGGEA